MDTSRLLAVAVSFACVFVAAASGADPPTSRAIDLTAAAAKLESLYDKLAEQDRQLPRDTFDPAAIVEQVGRDPQKLFEFVRDHTYWVPYQGALRGARGVLGDRLGNSLDRSLLLAELLRSAGYETRLANATLDKVTAKRVVDAARTPPAATQTAADGRPAETRQQVLAQASQIEIALGTGKRPDLMDQTLKDAADHWWVQARTNKGWKELDPTFADAQFGQDGLAPCPHPIDFGPAGAALPIVAASVHQVVVHVVIEKWDAGKLSEHTVVSATVQPAVLGRGPLVLVHIPVNVPVSGGQPDAATVKRAALAEKEWLPVLVVDGKKNTHFSFDDGGGVNEKPTLRGAERLGKATGGLFGDMSGDLTGASSTQQVKKSSLTAEWLDYEIHTPGRPDRHIRREVFDLIGPAARAGGLSSQPLFGGAQRLQRALILAGATESLLLTHRPSTQSLLHLLYDGQLSQRDKWLRILREPDRAKRRQMANSLTSSSPLHVVALARHVLSPASDAYLDRVNIVNYRTQLLLDDKGQTVRRETMDVVANDVAARGQGAEAFTTRVRQGVADTAAEILPHEEGAPGIENTFRLFSLPEAREMKLLVLRDPKDAAIAGLALAADVRSRVAADLSEGFAVVMPEKPLSLSGAARIGWWRVNPVTGETVGVMDTGYHADLSERGTEEAFLENDTAVRTREAEGFWDRHPTAVAKDLGLDPTSMEDIGAIIEHQTALIEAGLL